MQHVLENSKALNSSKGNVQVINVSLSSLAASLVPTLDSMKLKDYRRKSFTQLENSKPVSSKNEDFKYTNFHAHLKPFKKLKASMGIESVKKISSSSSSCVVLNGRFSEDLSENFKEYVTIYEVSQELPEVFYEASNHLTQEYSQSPFKLLSDVTFSQLIFIDLPENEELSLEISYVNLSDKSEQESLGNNPLSYTAPKIFVNMRKNSSAKIVENVCSYDDHPYFNNHSISFSLDEESRVDHTLVQNENKNSLRASTIFFHQKGKSIFKTKSLNFGSMMTRNEVYPLIQAEYSESWLIGANLLSGDQHVDNFTVIDHAVPNCESHELYKGLYSDKSVGVFSGTIIVREDAQKTNAYQSNSSILLSDSAESFSRPQLKIWADDVKCSHGATVGQVDEEALFYLMARGIPEKEAKIILTRSYLGEVISHIDDDILLSNIEELLNNKLSQVI